MKKKINQEKFDYLDKKIAEKKLEKIALTRNTVMEIFAEAGVFIGYGQAGNYLTAYREKIKTQNQNKTPTPGGSY